MEVPQLWVKVSFFLSIREMVDVISYKLMAIFKQKIGGSEHMSRVCKNVLSSCRP